MSHPSAAVAEDHSTPAIEFINVSMRFGNFAALSGINLSLKKHCFHVLLGENGAGKSTLVKCLVGYQAPTGGQITVNGRETRFGSPREAHLAGLGMVYQNFTLADQLSVEEHFILSKPGNALTINWRKESRELRSFLQTMPFSLDLKRRCNELASGEKQKLEILLQLYQRPKILILDEPSSVLTPFEADEVFALLRQQVDKGELTVILITHKFREMQAYGDRVAVLRRGQLVAQGEVADFSAHELAELMMGEAIAGDQGQNRLDQEAGPVRLSITGLSLANSRGGVALDNLSLQVRAGEVLGLAGVSGNGQKELVEALSGLHPAVWCQMNLDGQGYQATSGFFKRVGLNILPELPLQNACVGNLSVWENLSLRSLDQSRAAQLQAASQLQSSFGIKAQSLSQAVKSLSGGNIQRVVLARELRADTKILVVANPCFGLDFQAADYIRGQILAARANGCAVLLISEDIDEVLALSDRVGVMFEGKIVYESPIKQADPRQIGIAMAGHKSLTQAS